MPDARRRRCRICNRHESVVGPISWSGLCIDHSHARFNENNDSIHAGQGIGHERRRYGIAVHEFGPRVALALKQAGVFGTVLDDHGEGAT